MVDDAADPGAVSAPATAHRPSVRHLANLFSEEPAAGNLHGRICGGPAGELAGLPDLDDPESMRKFMCKITSCRAYDLWRRRSRAEVATSADADVELAADDRTAPDPRMAVEIARLERAYATLPPAQRIAHVLHHYYGFTDADLENELGFTRTNSRTLIRRANLALQRATEPCDE